MNYCEVRINTSISLTDTIFNILDDAKTENIKIVDLINKSSIADAFMIATCRSTRHADATADELTKKLKKLVFYVLLLKVALNVIG